MELTDEPTFQMRSIWVSPEGSQLDASPLSAAGEAELEQLGYTRQQRRALFVVMGRALEDGMCDDVESIHTSETAAEEEAESLNESRYARGTDPISGEPRYSTEYVVETHDLVVDT